MPRNRSEKNLTRRAWPDSATVTALLQYANEARRCGYRNRGNGLHRVWSDLPRKARAELEAASILMGSYEAHAKFIEQAYAHSHPSGMRFKPMRDRVLAYAHAARALIDHGGDYAPCFEAFGALAPSTQTWLCLGRPGNVALIDARYNGLIASRMEDAA